MILFLDEERAYLNWVTHHRTGFVLDCSRHPSKTHLALHRASCPAIKRSPSKRTHWTTGKHQKICCLDADQLRGWAHEQAGVAPADCDQCFNGQEDAEIHLTRLDRDILEVVLEIAAIHLDGDDGAYCLTVGTVGRCLGKTESQLANSLGRLVADELLILPLGLRAADIPSPRTAVLPTIKALRTIPDYAPFSDKRLAAELKKLG